MTPRAETVTILFTDLVNSTDLLQRVGDETAQHVLETHHRFLRDAVAAHGGAEVKWTGDGLMVAFTSAMAALRCAIAMQQAARRPADGEPLQIRVGLQVGEALHHDATDYFGTTVVIANRLCGQARAGEILCTAVVRALIPDGSAFDFRDRGELALKGIAAPVSVCEVLYEHDSVAMLAVTPFVGRGDVIAALSKKLDDAGAGKGSLVMLVGEPGIGKTRTAEEFAAYARHKGAMVLRGRCYDGEWAPPFSPFVEAIRSYAAAAPPDRLAVDLGPDAAVLSRIAPALREHLPDIAEPPSLQPEGERYRLLEAASAFFSRIASRAPVVLLLDDLHWADKGTIAMLRHVARAAASKPVLMVGAYRDVELDRRHPLAAALANLRRETAFERIPLKGLAAEEVGQLLDVIAEQDVPRPLVHAIASETNGNPFFIREVLLHLIEERKIVQKDGRWSSTAPIAEMGIPEGVREVIGRRLSRLGETCNRMLTAASAMAGGFTWDEIRAITDRPDDALLDALDEALGAQVLRETVASAYDFTHALIRHTLYEELSTPRRVMLHHKIGEALERLHSADIEAHLAELAHHFHEAAAGGDAEKAIHYARRAGDQAMAQVAWEAGAANYERALQAMDLIPIPDERVRIDVLLALGRALEMGGGDRARWKAVFQDAAELARGAGDHERYARAALGFATLLTTPGMPDAEVVRMLEEALQLPGPAESALRAMVLARLGNELSFADQRERKQQLLADALQVARSVDDPATLAYVLANVTWEDLDAAQALSLAREQIEAASRAGDKFGELRAHNVLAARLLVLGDRAGFDRAVDEEERLQRELRFVDYWTSLHRALQARMEGQFDAAERLARQAFAELQHDDPENAVQGLGTVIFEVRRHQGRLLEMEPAVKANAGRYPSIPAYRAALARVYTDEAGRRDDARAAFDEVAEFGFGRLPSDATLPSTLSLLADVCWVLGDAARAPELYRMLLPREGECVVLGWANTAWGPVSRSLAVLAATMRRWEDAERHFEDALRTNAELRDKPWLAQTRAQYGAVLLARGAPGDRERALALLQLALDAAQEMGMKKVVEDCQALKVQAADIDRRSF